MRRYALLAVVVLLFATAPQAALACSCAQFTKAQHGENAEVVFTGVATGIRWIYGLRQACSPSSADAVSIVFTVETVYKGEVPKDATVSTVAGGASCGYTFEAGKRYTVFASRLNGRLETGLCRGNVEGAIAPGEYGLAQGRAP